jgi:hypothetical protein
MSKYYKITLAHPYSLMVSSLNEPAPMIAPILFWMDGNSSTDFGLANHVQHFHFGWIFSLI